MKCVRYRVQHERPGAIDCSRKTLEVPARNRQSKYLRLVLLVVSGILCVFSQLAHSAQEVCVVSELGLRSQSGCINLDQLPNWLKRSVRRDATGQVAEDVLVRIRPGVHRLRNSLVIDSSVWPPGGRKLRIEGAGADRTIISGAVTVVASQITETEREGKSLPRGSIRIALKEFGIDAPVSLADVRFGSPSRPDFELFADGHRMPRSRWPKSGSATVSDIREMGELSFTIRNQKALRYAAEPALMLAGYFAHDWAYEVLRGKVNDTDDGFHFSRTKPSYGVKIGQRVWIENALRDIILPGEWAYDPTNNSIYTLPPSDGKGVDFEVSKVSEGFVFSKVWNVAIVGIGFTGFRDNAIRVDQGIDFTIRSISISNIGGGAMGLHGRGITAEDLLIADIGGSGVSIGGGDRKYLIPGRVALRRCRIERVGQLIRTYSPAVGVDGVGNEVSNCALSDGPHVAILFHGNDHLIEANLIEQFVQETDDAGAIYTGGDWTERGTKIRGNLIRNIGNKSGKYGANAIYLDDQASGLIVTDNLIINAPRGVLIGGGRDNQVNGNTFVGCGQGIYIDARGVSDIETRGTLANLNLHKKFAEIRADSPQYLARYPQMLAAGMAALGRAGNNVANDNVFVGCRSVFTVKAPATGALQPGLVSITKVVPQIVELQLNDPKQIPVLREKLGTIAATVLPAGVTTEIP